MSSLEAHYSVKDVEARILAAVRAAGLDPGQRLTPVQLAALDHFHTGGFSASLVLKELAQIRSGDRVLDIGAGLAGPARMLAASPGCRVDCIDLSSDYCVAAVLLNRLTGLEDKVSVRVGSALAIPFDDNSFDVVWMQNVGMNIQDKLKMYQEIHRVLAPGGRLAFQEMIAGDTPVTYFPLPWATDASDNLLISAGEVQALLAQSGLTASYFEDVSEAPLPAPPQGTPEAAAQAPLSLSVYVDNLAQKADNAMRSLKQRQIRLVRCVARAQ